MDSELFTAILAMDAYNRGYNAAIELPDEIDTEIGNATIYDTQGNANAQSVNFME
jgi:hypothetical protein